MKRSIILACMASVLFSGCTEELPQLPQLNLDKTSVTVSGISSGGYMAHQYHIAYSDEVVAAALFASGPYGCSRGDLNLALADCVDSESPPDINSLYQQLVESAAKQEIAPLENLNKDKVWIFHGTNDIRVSRAVTVAQRDLYQKLGVEAEEKFDVPAGHGLPTDGYGVNCETTAKPHINNCSYDGAGEVLRFFYSKLQPKTKALSNLMVFDQASFLDEGAENTLADSGFLYIPKDCQSGKQCRLHIAFHGCLQNEESIEKAFVENAGYNDWAEANNIVVLYPQTKSSYMPLNPNACWDWWGYTGPGFQTRKGAQLKHINNMVKKL